MRRCPRSRSASARCSSSTVSSSRRSRVCASFTTLVRVACEPVCFFAAVSAPVASKMIGGTCGPSLRLHLFHQLQRPISSSSEVDHDSIEILLLARQPAPRRAVRDFDDFDVRAPANVTARPPVVLLVRTDQQQLLHALLRGLLDGGERLRQRIVGRPTFPDSSWRPAPGRGGDSHRRR